MPLSGEPPLGRAPASEPTRPLPPVTPAPLDGSSGTAGRVPKLFTPRYGALAPYLLIRLLAFLIDVPGIAFLAIAFVYGGFGLDSRFGARSGHASFAGLALASLGGALVFAMLCEGIVGTTLGKALFALHVHRARGGYAGLGRALVRAILRPVDLLLIGPLLAAVTPRHQRLGDFAAGTTVARSPAGFAAPLVAAVLLGGLVYAQFAFGGGLDASFAAVAETVRDVPAWRDNATGIFEGVGAGTGAGRPAGVAASPTPDVSAPAALETPAAAVETPAAAVETPAAAVETPAAGVETPAAPAPEVVTSPV